MNPRVSRSSALASKATGFPIAKVAARLAVGYTLDEIANDITGGATPASFEPTIDYVVTKVPRFAFEKFKGAEATLSTSMKSVGEVMAIGRIVRREPAEGAARAGDRAVRARPGARARECRPGGDRERAGAADAGPAAGRGRGAAAGLHGRADQRRSPASTRGSSSGCRRSSRPRSRSARKGLPQRRRRDAAAEGDGLFRRAAGAAGAALGACRRAR